MGHTEKIEDIRDLRQTRRSAYEKAVCEHYKCIYRFLAHLTRDQAAAEELTQETFAAAWASIAGYEGRGSMKAWLHRIAHRKFIDAKRRFRRDTDLMTQLKQNCSEPQTSDPLHNITADENVRLLYDAMHRLRPSEYLLILLHYLQGLSFGEMAKVTNRPTGTVKWQTSRALKKLKAHLTAGV